MRRLTSLVRLALVLAFTPHLRAESGSPIAAEADAILAQMKSSHYSHKTEVQAENGLFNVDCSGLARLILRHAAPASLARVTPEPKHNFARAVAFYETFAAAPEENSAPGWRRIRRLAEAEPGDLIAWRRAEIIPGSDTGHVVIVREKPVRSADGRYHVKILDSTGTAHGSDSRGPGVSGIGTGTIGFLVNEADEPTAVLWSDQSRTAKEAPIAIGRVAP